MQNNVYSDIFWYGDMLLNAWAKKKKNQNQNYKNKRGYMENCEAMNSSTHLFAYSYWLFKKCFVENFENSKFHILYYLFFIRFTSNFIVPFEMFYFFYWINLNMLNLDRISSLILLISCHYHQGRRQGVCLGGEGGKIAKMSRYCCAST